MSSPFSLGNTIKPKIDSESIQALSSDDKQKLFKTLLDTNGSQLLTQYASNCSDKFALKLLYVLGQSVCTRLNLPEDFVDVCIDAGLRCESVNQPNLVHEMSSILASEQFPLDTILFWFCHYNFKYFTLGYSSQQSYSDDPGYYKSFWETVYHMGGCGIIEFLRGRMHAGQTLVGLSEENKHTPFTSNFSFPGIPHVTTLAAKKSKEPLTIGVDTNNMKLVSDKCKQQHKIVMALDDTDISSGFTRYQGQDFGDEDLGDGVLQQRQQLLQQQLQQIDVLEKQMNQNHAYTASSASPVTAGSGTAPAVASLGGISQATSEMVQSVAYYNTRVEDLEKKIKKVHTTIERTIRNQNGDTHVPHKLEKACRVTKQAFTS